MAMPGALSWSADPRDLFLALERWTRSEEGKRAALAAIPEAAPEARVRVVVLSDMNGRYGSALYREQVHEAVQAVTGSIRPSLVLSTGDMVAGMKAGLDYEAMWGAFHEAVTLPLRRAEIPFAPTPGNHDGTNYPGFELERQVYRQTWEEHKPALDFVDSRFYPRRYAYLHQGVLFVSIDASTVGKLKRPQIEWLDEVLAAQADVPVKIVYGHVPIVPFVKGRADETLADEALESLMVKHEVSAYLSGHHHAFYPGRREQSGLRMISMACLGGGPRVLNNRPRGAEPEARALLVLEIDPQEGIVSAEALDAASHFHERIARDTLPERVGEGAWEVVRDDL